MIGKTNYALMQGPVRVHRVEENAISTNLIAQPSIGLGVRSEFWNGTLELWRVIYVKGSKTFWKLSHFHRIQGN